MEKKLLNRVTYWKSQLSVLKNKWQKTNRKLYYTNLAGQRLVDHHHMVKKGILMIYEVRYLITCVDFIRLLQKTNQDIALKLISNAKDFEKKIRDDALMERTVVIRTPLRVHQRSARYKRDTYVRLGLPRDGTDTDTDSETDVE